MVQAECGMSFSDFLELLNFGIHDQEAIAKQLPTPSDFCVLTDLNGLDDVDPSQTKDRVTVRLLRIKSVVDDMLKFAGISLTSLSSQAV